MKYYKVLENGYASTGSLAKVGVILPEDYRADRHWCTNLAGFVNKYPNDFQEVSEEEYLKQEGKMEEFVLPERWYVRATRENEKILRDWRNGDHTGWCDNLIMLSNKFWGIIDHYKKSHTEITFEQFKKYVLKEEQIGRKIIGYKLIKPEYEKAAAELIYGGNKIHGLVQVEREWDILKEAGVLNLWFEPVYEKQIPDITIKGYKAEFFDGYVKFGCQTYNKDFVLQLGEFLSKSRLELERQEEVMKVVEYYKNK